MGGPREGTPGKGYVNRTDLMTNRAPQTPTRTAASGDMPTGTVQSGPIGADQVPSLTDAGNPEVPMTDRLPYGPGRSPLGAYSTPMSDPVRLRLAAAMVRGGANGDLARLIMRLDTEGR